MKKQTAAKKRGKGKTANAKKSNARNIVTICLPAIILLVFAVLRLTSDAPKFIESENRNAETLPALSAENILSGSVLRARLSRTSRTVFRIGKRFALFDPASRAIC